MIDVVSWQYFKLGQGGPADHFFVRINDDELIAEVREAGEPEWERQDAWFAEVTYNGRGAPCTEAEALATVSA